MQTKTAAINRAGKNSLLVFIVILLSGCACDFLGLEHVVDSKTPFEKRAEDEKKHNPYEPGSESDSETAGNLKTVFFNYKSAVLTADQMEVLNNNIEELVRNPDIQITISAHSDQVGGPRYNNKLSKARAQFVIRQMTSKGVAADRIKIQVKGPLEPLVSDNSDQIKNFTQILQYRKLFNKNRRVNFIVR